MAIIRVEPGSIHAYAADAQAIFEAMRADLEALVADTVQVRYFGPNAVQFKVQAGELAAGFSRSLLADLQAIAEAVSVSTSNIAAALGGAAITVPVDGTTVPVPAIDQGDGSVDVDTAALEGLRPVVAARFGSLAAALGQHLARLQATDWEGRAKQGAVEQVHGFTAQAQARSEEARTRLTAFIDDQVQSVLAADR
jgi:hypothetical protein